VSAAKPTRRYVSISDTVYTSVAFRTLPGGALKLWIDMRTQYNGGNNGAMMSTMSVLKHRGWNSSDKLVRGTRELLSRGLIAYTRRCGPNVFHRAALFAFTDHDIAANERHGVAGARATRAYLEWMPGNPMAPLDELETAKRAFRKQEPNGTRIRKATAPEIGKRTPETAPEIGKRQKPRKPAPVLDLSAIERPEGPFS
jgi:hypothetical protein